MKNNYISIFLLLSLNSQAQLSINTTTLSATVGIYEDTLFSLTITNNINSNMNYWWKVIKPQGFPEIWETYVCDPNACYIINLDKCPNNNAVQIIANGTNLITIHFDPKSLAGASNICFKLYTDAACTNEIASTDCNDLLVAGTTSTNEIVKNEMLIYPNPTSDYFSIKNDEDITSVKVYDVLGKLIISEKHKENQKHEINLLKNGIYIVQTYCLNNELKSSSTLVKQ